MLIVYLIKLIDLYIILLIADALLSWFPGAYDTVLGRLLEKICEPYLKLFRKLPLEFAGISFSVVAAVIVLEVIQKFLLNLLI